MKTLIGSLLAFWLMSQFAVAEVGTEYQQLVTPPTSQQQAIPATEWRAIQEGVAGTTNSQSPYAGVLINTGTIEPLAFRIDYLMPFAQWGILTVIVLILVFYALNGSAKIEAGFSGKKILRWSNMSRFLHWGMVASFLILALTGLTLMIGRLFIKDSISHQAWGSFAVFCDLSHDYVAPVFAVFWLASMLKWAHLQMPKKHDLAWIKSGGGYLNFGKFKGQHEDAGFANAGEKILYWIIVLTGIGVIGSGAVLLFQNFEPSRDFSVLALVTHGIFALSLIVIVIGHIAMAVLLSEGGAEGMTSGYCDENWAKQHHNLWYKEMSSKNEIKYKQ